MNGGEMVKRGSDSGSFLPLWALICGVEGKGCGLSTLGHD
jgi:hypothetical protein